MTAAEKAYKAAQAAIAEAKADGATELSFDSEEFHTLETIPPEIADLDTLTFLDLDKTKISDLTPLAAMTGMQRLFLNQTGITDLTPLAVLTGMQQLSLSQTGITDLTPLAGLTEMQRLFLDQTGITDLSPLAGMAGMQELYLNQTGIGDLSPLAGMTGMQHLSLNQTGIADLSPLAGMTGMQHLSLNQTGITNLSPLAGMTGMQSLLLDRTGIADLSPLAGMTGMQSLLLDRTGIADLSPLAGMTGIQSLSLNQTGITNLSPLAGMTGMQSLSLNQTGITNLSPLAGMTGMQSLDLEDTRVFDLRPLLGLKKLADARALPLYGGLSFKNSPATRADPRIAEIAEIEDAATRARTLFDYLETWEPPELPTPEPDPLFRVGFHNGQLEVAASLPTEAEREERLKQVLHQQLQDLSKALAQAAGNRFFRLSARARGLVEQAEKPFADLDLLLLHLAIEDLRQLEDLGREEQDGDPFPPEVLIPLSDVLRIGPGLTLGHPDVDTLTERANRRRNARPVPQYELDAQNAFSKALAENTAAIGKNLRDLSQMLADSQSDESRESQKAVNWNAVWKVVGAASAIGGAVGSVATGVAQDLLTPVVKDFIVANWPVVRDVIALHGPVALDWTARAFANVSEFAGLAVNVPPPPPHKRPD